MTNEEAINVIELALLQDEGINFYTEEEYQAMKFLIEAVKERPKGKWIVNTGNSYFEPPYFCSECNCSNNWKAPFCEHCGADMR